MLLHECEGECYCMSVRLGEPRARGEKRFRSAVMWTLVSISNLFTCLCLELGDLATRRVATGMTVRPARPSPSYAAAPGGG